MQLFKEYGACERKSNSLFGGRLSRALRLNESPAKDLWRYGGTISNLRLSQESGASGEIQVRFSPGNLEEFVNY